jgi:hypothetical protein
VLLDSAGIDISTHPRGQDSPDCASDGQNFLVSFNTYRCDSAYTDVYVARVNANGEVLDTNGFAVCELGGDQLRSKIAYGNGVYVVVWEDNRNFDSTGFDIYGTRVTSDGAVSDAGGKRITHFKYLEERPDLAWGGESFLAIWEDGNYGEFWDISGMRIDTLAEVLDSSPVVISAACDAQFSASSAWCDSFYLAIWEENQDVYGARLDRFGNILDSATIRICSAPEEQKASSLARGEESFLAVWEDFRNGNFDIYGARIDSGGEVLDTSGLPIQVDSTFDQRRPKVAFDGSNYLVVWQKMLDSTGANYKIEGLRVTTEGVPIDLQPLSISSGDKGSFPDAAFAGGKYLVVWTDANFYDIYGALVDTNGTVNSQFGIRLTYGIQQNPVVASSGDSFLVVWEDFGTSWPDANIIATRITSGGVILDPAGIEVAVTSDVEQLPSVTFDGKNYVVTWNRLVGVTGKLYVSRVTPQGVVLDPDGVYVLDISPYSGTSISSGPVSGGQPPVSNQSLMLYSKYQDDAYNSLRIAGAFFWGDPQPNLPPEPFSLLLPVDRDTVMKPVFLDWEDASDPNPFDQVTYTVYVSSSGQFAPESTMAVDGLNLSRCYVSPQKDSLVYWWKVRAQDDWGETTWSNQIYSFDLENYGDINGDGNVNLGDVVFLVSYLYRGGASPQPLSAGDINGDCQVSLGDVVYFISYLYKGGAQPVRGCA